MTLPEAFMQQSDVFGHIIEVINDTRRMHVHKYYNDQLAIDENTLKLHADAVGIGMASHASPCMVI
jgi:hypothetical protein